MGETCLEIRGVTKRFGNLTAVDNVSLTIERGEFFSLLGPSGCGKTTLLRMIAGFETTTSGQILINGQDIAPLPPYKRPVNTVFQHYALFPHMNIFQNVAFGLERKRTPQSDIRRIVSEALEQVQLPGYEKRRPSQLSGGQKQRVALARALVMRPQVLLLDEPLGALDMKLRKEMQVELKNLQEQLRITFVFVTHDQEEALVMSDRIAVMNSGRLEQVGKSCSEIFERPRTQFVAHFMGASNILHGTIRKQEGRAVLHVPHGPSFEMESDREGDVKFVVRPEKLTLLSEPNGAISLPVKIADEIFQGTNTSWVVDHDGEKLIIIEQNIKAAEDEARFRRGDSVYVTWDPRHTIILED